MQALCTPRSIPRKSTAWVEAGAGFRKVGRRRRKESRRDASHSANGAAESAHIFGSRPSYVGSCYVWSPRRDFRIDIRAHELTPNDNIAGAGAITVKNSDSSLRAAPRVLLASAHADIERCAKTAICREYRAKCMNAKGKVFWHGRCSGSRLGTVAPARRLAGCGAGYVEVMVGKLRARVARAAAARGTWISCSLLLVSTLLGACNQTSTTSAAGAQPTAIGHPGLPTGRTAASQAAPPSTQASSPLPAAKSVEVSWGAPTRNTDGSALTNLAGYRVYYGSSPGALGQSVDVPSAGATDYVVQGLKTGTWYFAVVAYTNSGLESTRSSVVSKTIT
jgi:hypothetical protein